jgi:ligand-binding sensor domain-containing protein
MELRSTDEVRRNLSQRVMMTGLKNTLSMYMGAVFLLAFLLCSSVTAGQTAQRWQPFHAVQNLDLTKVRAIGEDADCLWFGTDDGLYCYDGHHAGKSDSIGGVRSILRDRNGVLWVGATDGVYRLDAGQTVPIRAFADVPGLTGVSAMLQTADGALWFGTARGLRRCDPVSESCEEEIEVDPQLRVDPDVTSLAEDDRGHVWLGTWGAGAYRYDLSSVAPVEGLESEAVFSITRDSNGNLWFGTTNGAFRHQPDGSLEQVLSDVPVLSVAEDAEHAIWLGTSDGVVQLFDGEMTTFTTADGLVGHAVQAIWQDAKEGSLWFGTEGGVSRFDGHFWHTFTTGDGLPHVTVLALAFAGEDVLWVGTADGICLLREGTCEPENTLTGLYVRDLWSDPTSDELWIAAAGRGLLRYDGMVLHHALDGNVQALGQDAAGSMWLSTFNEVYRYNRHTGTLTLVEFYETGIRPDESLVYSIFTDSRGSLWFGTESGLVRCSDELQPHCDRRYLEDRAVYAIFGDADGNLWLGTDAGVYPYVRSEDAVWDVPAFRAADGLADDVVFAVVRDASGDFWFGTDTGLTRYRPSKRAPRLEFAPAGTMRLTRSYGEAGLPLALLGADFRVNPERLRYIYTLQSGQTLTHGFAISDSLALPLRYRDVIGDNEYRLRVQALDPDLNASEEAVLDIVVKPRPFWRVPYIVIPGGLTLAAVLGVALYVFVTSIAVEQRYRDVELALSRDEAGLHVRARVEGEESTAATVSAAEMESLLERVVRPVLADLEEGRVSEDALRYLGRRLFETLFPGDLAALLDGHTLRLRLRFEESTRELAALPWEYAYGGRPLSFLGASPQIALVRDLSVADLAPEPRRVPRPLRVLVVASRPRDLPPLGLDAERERLEEVWKPLVERGEMVRRFLERGDKSTMDALDSWLGADEGWDIVHFIAHGGVGDTGAHLYLEEADGWHDEVDQERLSVLFAGRLGPGRVRAPALVVLNACQTAGAESAQATLGLAPVLVRRGQLLAAVGMQFPINDDAAKLFAAKFYEALFRAGQVDYAIAKARNAIISAKRGVEGRDWGSPVLYMQTREGRLFRFVGAEWLHVWRTARSRVLGFVRRQIKLSGAIRARFDI